MTAHEDDEPTATGGSASLKGYLYQAKVSAWLGLELVAHQRSADALVLEGSARRTSRPRSSIRTRRFSTAPRA